MNPDTPFSIPAGLLQALEQYLSTKPFREAEPFIQAIRSLTPIAKPPEPVETRSEKPK